MLLSSAQQKRFWREWKIACSAQGWTKTAGWTDPQRDNERHSLLSRAGFSSLTLVDPHAGFDRVLEELAILQEDIKKSLAARTNVRRVQVWKCRQLASQIDASLGIESSEDPRSGAYLRRILLDRFRTQSIDDVPDDQLSQLRNTLAARLGQVKRRSRTMSPGSAAMAATAADPF